MKFIDFKGSKIAFTTEGRGTPVVLIHGFCEDSSMWNDFKTDLIEEHERVLCPDLPGFGHSDVVEDVTIEYMADAIKAILDNIQQEKAIVIGHSMGGYVALAFAKKYPEYLLGLGLINSHPYTDDDATKQNRRRGIEFIQTMGSPLYVKQLFPKLFPPDFKRINAFLMDKLILKASRFPVEGIIYGQKAMANRNDHSQTLINLKCPALFIIGEHDEVISEKYRFKQATLAPVSAVHIIEKGGHMSIFEHEPKTQEITRKFTNFCMNNF